MNVSADFEALTGSPAKSTSPLGGTARRVELADGRMVVAKRHDHVTALRAEVAGLRWLDGPVPVPSVLGYDDSWLVLELVEPGSPSAGAAASLPASAASSPHAATRNSPAVAMTASVVLLRRFIWGSSLGPRSSSHLRDNVVGTVALG